MPEKPLSAGLGTLMIVMTLVGWSSVPLFLHHFVDYIDLWTSNGWRYGVSAFLWAPVLLVAFFRNRLPAGLWKAALIPSIVNAIGQVLFVWAHYQIEPGLLTFGLRTQILFAAIGAYLLFPAERRIITSPGYLAGGTLVIIGTAGAVMLAQEPPDLRHLFGVALAVGSGLLFASYGLAVRRYMVGINSVLAFAAISQYTALAMIVLMLVLGERSGVAALDMQPDQIVWLLVSAVIGIALGHVFYYMAIARLGVAVSAGVLQLQPFLVAIGSAALFGELLTAGQWISGALAVAGALLMLAVQRIITKKRVDQPLALAEARPGT